jgi:predicted metal-dependent TIM-barrel fold hydrolase
MDYVDIHAHMVSRTTDDYEQMALCGCRALTEPAFWAGFDRQGAGAFASYFEHLTHFEPQRAQKYGIQHYTWICLNAKEADDRALAAEVLPLIPDYLDRPNVLGIGEAGLNRVTKNELRTFEEQVDLAARLDQLLMIHTPHLEDKWKGTRFILDVLRNESRLRPERVFVDHAEEHTLAMILDAGYWTGLTQYPNAKVSLARAADIIEIFGADRICVESGCDWGPSDPLAIPRFVQEMRRRRHPERLIKQVVWENPVGFLRQSPKFTVPAGEEAFATS